MKLREVWNSEGKGGESSKKAGVGSLGLRPPRGQEERTCVWM